MIAQDLQADLRAVLGSCKDDLTFRRLTDGITLLANAGEGMWDGLVGQMTISVDETTRGVTFPRDVLTPLQVNLDGQTTFPRDKYFRYHVNGPGSQYLDWSNIMWDDMGEHPVYREPSELTTVRVESDNALDDGKELTISYTTTDDREYTHTFTLDNAVAPVSSFSLLKINRVAKDVTVGEVKIYYVDPVDTLAGWYASDETDPMYRRVRLNAESSIELIYRRRTREITSWQSYIPIENKLAVIQAVRSVHYRYQMDLAKAMDFEMDAVRLLQQEQNVRNINNAIGGPQVLNYSSNNNERLFGPRTYRR